MAVRLALWLTHGSWLLIQITEVIRILKFAEGSCKVLGHWLTPSWQPQGLGLGWHTGHRALTLLLTLTEAGLAMLAAWWCVLTMFYLTECVSVVWTGLSSTSEWLEWAAASSGRPSPGWRGQAVSPEPHQARPGRREIAVKVFTVLLSHPAQPSPHRHHSHHRLSRESGKWFLQASERKNGLNSALGMIVVKSASLHRTRNIDKLRNMSIIQWIKKLKL